MEAMLEDEHSGRPGDELEADEEQAKALRMLDRIDPREAQILKQHYGLDGNQPLTLKEIGEKMGLTRERIRQIRRDALTKLYEYMNE
jgi:RNA polymerase primary sigma factor